MGKKKKKFNRKLNLFLILTLFLVLIIICIIILNEYGILKKENPNHFIEKNFTIQDECSIIAGKIIHPIDREEDCAIKCVARCEVQSLSYINSEFIKKEERCNFCQCLCK